MSEFVPIFTETKTNKMKELSIYEFQLKVIIDALRLTNNLHNCGEGVTCYDRQVRQAYRYAENALKGLKDEYVQYQ